MTTDSPIQQTEELPTPYDEIVAEKEPDQFIDLLCARSYFAGSFGANMPVQESRLTFEKWLENHTAQAVLSARLSDFKRMKEYYGRGNIKLWDEPDNNWNSVYLDDYIAELEATTSNLKGDK